MIRCSGCKREFSGKFIKPQIVFECRYCLGEMIDPRSHIPFSKMEMAQALKLATSWWHRHWWAQQCGGADELEAYVDSLNYLNAFKQIPSLSKVFL